jgi:hypothetical protein
MNARKETVVTTSKLKLRSPTKSKATQLDEALCAYSSALLQLMKLAQERFDPEHFIFLSGRNGKPKLAVRSLQSYSTWVNRELEIKNLRLNSHLKHGLIYSVSAALRQYTACFIDDVDSVFPYSNLIEARKAIPLDTVLSEALSCVTLSEEKKVREGLLKKQNGNEKWPLHLTSKDRFQICRSGENNRYYVALPINQAPQRRGGRCKESSLGLLNILENSSLLANGPWVYFPLAMGRRDRNILLEVEKYRDLGRQAKNRKDKPIDIGACALLMKEDKYFLEVSVRHVCQVAAPKNIMAVRSTPYEVTHMVTDSHGNVIDSSQHGREWLLRRILSSDKSIAERQARGLVPKGRYRHYLVSAYSHQISNYLVEIAKKHRAHVVLLDGSRGQNKNGGVKKVDAAQVRIKKRKNRILSLWDQSRIRKYLEYKSVIQGLPKPFILKGLSKRICSICQAELSSEDINWKNHACTCAACGHSESIALNTLTNMISRYRRIVASKGSAE